MSRVELDGITSRGFSALPGISQIGLKTSIARIHDCIAEGGDTPFLQLTEQSQAFVNGCDLKVLKQVFAADATSSVVETGNRLP